VRYGHRFAKRRTLRVVPTVEVIVPMADYGEFRYKYTVVRRVHGFTDEHALSRAIAWGRKHGDPR
jgi:hypothetical protein